VKETLPQQSDISENFHLFRENIFAWQGKEFTFQLFHGKFYE
jgi:hypothetical protein